MTTDKEKTRDDLTALATLLLLQKDARKKREWNELLFFILNQTFRLVPYQQAVFWEDDSFGRDLKITHVSGNSTIDPKSPFYFETQKLIRSLLDEYDLEDEHLFYQKGEHILVKFSGLDGQFIGGLLLKSVRNMDKKNIPLFEELLDAYRDQIRTLRRTSLIPVAYKKPFKWAAIALLVGLTFFPVRLSAVIPAEVIARDPVLVTVPFEGTIKDIHISPNSEVAQGDLLFTLDNTELQNTLTLAQESLTVSQSLLSESLRGSINNPDNRAHINKLRSEIALRELEVQHARHNLEKSTVRASQPGVAVFSLPQEWIGKPVRTGEKIMTLSKPDETELLLRMPADSAIEFDTGVEVRFSPHNSLLRSYPALINSTSYEATPDKDGLLTYKIHADFQGSTTPELGVTGTGHIYGAWTILGYQILRRPIQALRNLTGWW